MQPFRRTQSARHPVDGREERTPWGISWAGDGTQLLCDRAGSVQLADEVWGGL